MHCICNIYAKILIFFDLAIFYCETADFFPQFLLKTVVLPPQLLSL